MKIFQSTKIKDLLIIITLITVFWACKKTDYDNSGPLSVSTVNGSVAGLVTDLNNKPISNATVTAGTFTVTTDIDGKFSIKNVQLSKVYGFVKITKDGYFTGSRNFLVNENTVSNVKITLIPKTVSGNFAAASGGNINVLGGGAVNFNSSSIVNATSGTVYTGDVSVSTFYLNPADANYKDYMPGDLRGMNTSNKEGILKSFGMASVEMNDAAGQKLQLATGKTATITLPIPSALQATAPPTISLWYFDDTEGIWKEEGTATKQSTNYVGTVKHFSFWSAGELGTDIRLDATFKSDSAGIVLTNKLVTITSSNYGTTTGYTNNAGTVSGLIPANEVLAMKVFNDCGGLIYTQNIGPFSTDANLGSINVIGNNLFYSLAVSTITGTVVNCNNIAVTNGSVQLTIESDIYKSVVTNGNFSITFTRCNNSFDQAKLIAYDSITTQPGTTNTIDVSYGSTKNVGQIKVCNTPTPPVAGFTFSSGSATIPVTVTFTNTSINAANYLWDLGDGTKSTLQDPVHIYTTAGDYVVTLTVTGQGGTTSTINKTIHLGTVANDSYITLTLNGVDYSWGPPDYTLSGTRTDTGLYSYTSIKGDSISPSPTFYILGSIHHDNAPAGNVPPGNYPFSLYTIMNGVAYNSYYPNGNTETSVTEYSTVDSYITGSATGWVKNFPVATTDSFPFTCTYRVKRIQ